MIFLRVLPPDGFSEAREISRMFGSDMQIRFDSIPTDRKNTDRMMGGLIGSSALHFLVLLLVFGLPWLMQGHSQTVQIVPVNLVQLSKKTASPSSPEMAPLPQEKAKEVSNSETAEAVPVAQTPPPPATQQRAVEKSSPELLTTVKPDQKPETPKPVKAPKPDVSPAAEARRKPLPTDDLNVRLKLLAQLRQPPPPIPSKLRPQEGSGSSNLTATSADVAQARDATYGVKDFIRAQVERRWNLDGNVPKGGGWLVAIHIVLSPDGKVRQADIVDSPRYHTDSAYREFALSARNAVLLSSPLTVPPGEYDIAKDIVIDFNSKQVLQ